MLVLLFITVFPFVFGGPLPRQENESLKDTCGRIHDLNWRRYRRSMNTSPATRYAAPFTVLIHESTEDVKPRERLLRSKILCTGTIISPRHVLTAAHCLGVYNCATNGSFYLTNTNLAKKRTEYRQKLNYLFVSAPTKCQSSCDTELDNKIALPKKVYISRDYINGICGQETESRGDIAIIELHKDLSFTTTVKPACLYAEKIQDKTLLTMYGYGSSNDDNVKETIGVLRKHEATTIPKEECSKHWESPLEDYEDNGKSWDTTIFKDEICSRNEREIACGGDSGSGLILSKDHRAYVTAVSSWGPPCEPDEISDSAEMVDVSAALYNHLDWICAATGVCPKRYLTLAEKTRLKKKYVRMGLSKDFAPEPIRK